MKERIRQIRKEAGLSQTKFGERLGLSLSAVQKWEIGQNTPDGSTVKLICEKFGISETWLRTGAGDMKAPRSKEQEMAAMVRDLMAESPESFRRRLVTVLLRFDPDGPEWALLERIYKSVADEAGK